MLQINKETANTWEYKVGNDRNIANFVNYPNAFYIRGNLGADKNIFKRYNGN